MEPERARKDPDDGFGLVGEVLEGRYRIDRVVAVGGFGVVYEGYHPRLRVPVAVKVFKVEAPRRSVPERESLVREFLHEAETIAGLRHPHIVAALDAGVSTMPSGARAPWMVLEWLTGVTLQDDLLARRAEGNRGRSPAEAVALLRPVLDAVAHAHSAGVVHRDLKPANIMLVPVRSGVSPYVLDFGVAKETDPDDEAGSGATQTRSAALSFSPRYAAPEQVSGARTGAWTDVHALGLILTELLTDAEPYPALTRAALCAQVLSPDRPTPAALGVDAGALEAVLGRALAFRPDDRYPDAGALMAALDDALATTSRRERPSSTSAGEAREEKLASREKRLLTGGLALAGLVGLLLLAGIATQAGRTPTTLGAVSDDARGRSTRGEPPMRELTVQRQDDTPARMPVGAHDAGIADARREVSGHVSRGAPVRRAARRGATPSARSAVSDAGQATRPPAAEWDPG